jgi:hypothetical protein
MKTTYQLPLKQLAMLGMAMVMAISCDNHKNAEKQEAADQPDTVKATVLNVGGELFSVPSPIQTAMLVQKAGVNYDKSYLTPSNKVNTYATDQARALMLGIYGADLGYVSLYNQTQDALGYLAAIKQLSDKIGLSAAFDNPTMERIKNNITNRDSMMGLVSLAYREGDAYLKENSRSETGTLILAGGWVESMHFSTNAYKSKPNEQFKYRIAEQKQGLTSLLRILSQNNSAEVRSLRESLDSLAKVYEDIKFKYSFEEPRTDSVKKVTYINSTTEVTITDDQLARITDQLAKIRNSIINNTKS